MAGFSVVCRRCGSSYGFDSPWRCRRCGSPLHIEYEARPPRLRGRGVWRYRGLLAYTPPRRVVLGEGGTPMVRRWFRGVKLLLKLEYLNPTGSFKDRGTAVEASRAKSLGRRVLVEDSSGNTGLSVAAYAAAGGMDARIYVPRDAPEGKKNLIRLLGARLVEARDRADASRRAVEELGEGDHYVAHLWSPWFVEGVATVAYEVAEQMGWRTPDAVVVPVGSGSLLLGIAWGYRRLGEAGLLQDGPPRIIAVQAGRVAPLYEAVAGERPLLDDGGLADGIRVPSPPRIDDLVDAADGGVVLVGRRNIVSALGRLVSWGFLVEPTSAVVLAGLSSALDEGLVERGETVVLPLTGSGLKVHEWVYSVLYG